MSRLSSRAGVVAIALLAIATTSTAVIVAVDAGGPAVAGSSDSERTISVSGKGTVKGVPDTLVATFRIHRQASDVQAALNAAASDVRRVIDELKQQGVAGRDLQTADLSLDTSYDRNGNPDGYEASETLSVRIRPLDHVGRVISAAATAAGNSVSIDGLSLDITNDATLINQARSKAFAEAKAAASQSATLAGEHLGEVISIKETIQGSSGPGPQPYYAADALRTTAKAIAIRPGQQPVSVRLAVVWAIE